MSTDKKRQIMNLHTRILQIAVLEAISSTLKNTHPENVRDQLDMLNTMNIDSIIYEQINILKASPDLSHPPSKVVVLDSDKPVLIMPNNYSIESKAPEKEIINIETDTSNDIDKIEKLVEKIKPKSNDGIDLLINDIEEEEEKIEEEKDSGDNEKKTIKFN